MSDILITGFTPFDGRDVNASWVAAQTFTDANHLEIPVVWGAPMGALAEAIETYQPKTIISLGEGREGWFDIETRPRNARKHRKDNNGEFPTSDILRDGPDFYRATVNADLIQQTLLSQEIPIRISEDAGQFLCEETLYCLETLKLSKTGLEKVIFTHLPPYGTRVTYRNELREADNSLLKDFVERLVAAVEAS